jgi:hypothetical protein
VGVIVVAPFGRGIVIRALAARVELVPLPIFLLHKTGPLKQRIYAAEDRFDDWPSSIRMRFTLPNSWATWAMASALAGSSAARTELAATVNLTASSGLSK